VTVYEHLNDTLSIGFGPQTLGHYDSRGTYIKRETNSKTLFETGNGRTSLGSFEGPQEVAHNLNTYSGVVTAEPISNDLTSCINLDKEKQQTGQIVCY